MNSNTVEDVIDTNVVVKNMFEDIEKVESYEPDVKTDRTRRHIYNKLKSNLLASRPCSFIISFTKFPFPYFFSRCDFNLL